MAQIEIIGNPASTYTRVARMACEEKGVRLRFQARAAAYARRQRHPSIRKDSGNA